MNINVITIFPEMFQALTNWGITARAIKRGCYQLKLWNPRDHTQDAYHKVDDRPYGGGPGMVMQVGPLEKTLLAVETDNQKTSNIKSQVILLSPQGKTFCHQDAVLLSSYSSITFVCGRYEGIDQRFIDQYVDFEIGIGDFVVSGGELPAMVVIDSIVRLLPMALNCAESNINDSFANGLLDFPHYTRPVMYQGQKVPDVLINGHHYLIDKWRREQSLQLTLKKRPDLLFKARQNGLLSQDDETYLAKISINHSN